MSTCYKCMTVHVYVIYVYAICTSIYVYVLCKHSRHKHSGSGQRYRLTDGLYHQVEDRNRCVYVLTVCTCTCPLCEIFLILSICACCVFVNVPFCHLFPFINISQEHIERATFIVTGQILITVGVKWSFLYVYNSIAYLWKSVKKWCMSTVSYYVCISYALELHACGIYLHIRRWKVSSTKISK